MEKSIGKAVIVASESVPELGELGRSLAKELKKRKVQAEVRTARDSFIPDLAPYEFILFGAAADEKLASGDYQELYRSLQGVNFAGRNGAFFTLKNPSIFKDLAKMVKDSELRVLEPGLCVEGDAKDLDGRIATWVDKIMKQLQGA